MHNTVLFSVLLLILSTLCVLSAVFFVLRVLSQKVVPVKEKMDVSNFAGGFEPLVKGRIFYSVDFFLYLVIYLFTIVMFVSLSPWFLNVCKFGVLGVFCALFEFIVCFIGIYFVFKKRSSFL